MSHTDCKKCIFSKSVDNQDQCEMNIINMIKNTQTITIKDNYYYIENYSCKYGMSSKTVEDNKDLFKDIDIKSQILENNTIKYYMVVDGTKYDYDTLKICEQVNTLSVLPRFLSLCIIGKDARGINLMQSQLKDNLNGSIKWRIHNFLYDKDINDIICNIFQTNSKANQSSFFIIQRPEDIEKMLLNDYISDINYVINIDQPTKGFIKINVEDNLYNVFMSFNNYEGLTGSMLGETLEECIKSVDIANIYIL